jgi:predicted porin
MKKAVILGGAICVMPIVALAQSSVTLYGILDEGLMYTSNVNGGKKVALDSLSGLFGSRFGFSGTEDLGGDLKAIFTLESGVNLNNGQFGQGGTAFGRQAFVGLKSNRLGTVAFGRQYDMVFYFPEPLTAGSLVGGPVGMHPGDIDNAANTVRLNNAVRYMSPSYRGFSFGGEYSLGGVPGNFTANSGYSVGVGYTGSSLKVGAAFEYFKNPTATPGNGFFTAYANGASPLSQSLNKAYSTAQAYQVAIVAANYVIGATTLAASYSNVQYANLGPEFFNGTAIFNNFDIGASYQITPFLSAAVSYDYLKANSVETARGATVGNQHYNQVSVVVDYFLSKRTDVYFGAGWQRASGTSSLGTAAVANIDNLGDSSSNQQVLLRAGIRHKF